MKRSLIRLMNLILNIISLSLIFVIFIITSFFRKDNLGYIKNITWFGAYGNGNLGDDLIFYSLKRLLKKNRFNIKLSIRDGVKIKNYGVETFIKGEQFYSFYKYINYIKKSDAVFLGGGGLFEYYYPSKQAYRMILIYLCPLMIARILNKPTFILGIGVNNDRIRNKIIRYIYKKTLSESKVIITRDLKSKKGLLLNNVSTNIIDLYDPVFSLSFPKKNKLNNNSKTIGLLLWPYFLWPHFYENSEKISQDKITDHKNFVYKIKRIEKELRKKGYNLKFITFHFSDTILYEELGVDYLIKADLKSFIRQVSTNDIVISMRYHGQISSVLTETPVISLSVQQKMDAFMKNYNRETYNHDIRYFKVEDILQNIEDIFDNYKSQEFYIEKKNKFIKDTLEDYFSSFNFNN